MNTVKMSEEHIKALAELEKICFPRPWSEDALREEIENPTAYFITVVEGEDILGYGGMHCSCGECYIDNIAVFPSARRKGVATAVMKELENEARRRGGEFISLEVRLSNEAAVRLYTLLGFSQVGRRRNFYTDPVEDALILTKSF